MILCSRVSAATERSSSMHCKEHSAVVTNCSQHVILHLYQDGLCAAGSSGIQGGASRVEFVCFHVTGEMVRNDLFRDLGSKRQVRDWPIVAEYIYFRVK